MKQIKKRISLQNIKKKTEVFLFFISMISNLYSQQITSSIKGMVLTKDSTSIPYATVVLTKNHKTAPYFFKGTITDEKGAFEFNKIEAGEYMLRISSIGYSSITKKINIASTHPLDIETFILQDSTFLINETMVIAERIKGKSENEKNIYFINNKIVEASGNVPDMLRHIPGIQVDLKQNISLNGKKDILIFVEGKERDKSYISQLNPAQIDKIEVLTTPPSNYEGDISGIINIILKKDSSIGFGGHFFSEIPTTSAIVYSFPTYNFYYNHKKINLYTSYNGEINYENIDESTFRQIYNPELTISSVQHVRQNNKSHKFHYGVDYYVTNHDVISLYGFLNPYSSEQNGNVILRASGYVNKQWDAKRQEKDNNINLFNSIYYKHTFNNGSELSTEYSNIHIYSKNTLSYINTDNSNEQINKQSPKETDNHLKIDFITFTNKKTKLSTGVNIKIQSMQDQSSKEFHYNQQIYAWYGTVTYQTSKYNLNCGLRLEDAKSKQEDSFNKSNFSILPYAALYYKINNEQTLSISYRRKINRPSIYELTPYTYTDNPYDIRIGNSLLNSEYQNSISMEYALRFKSNYISSRLFYESKSDIINKLTLFDENSIFKTQECNLGSVHDFGMQILGSLSFGRLTITPSIRMYKRTTLANNYAQQKNIEDKKQWIAESDLTSILSFKHDFALSTIFQYTTAKNNIQDNAYCNALYFVSIDKTFKKNIKLGIVTALPFTKTFVYQGSDIKTYNFSSHYTGNLKLPTFPLMFRFSYQFNYGKKKTITTHKIEDIKTRPKSGF